jgi:predicted component of type VI protein secretion system
MTVAVALGAAAGAVAADEPWAVAGQQGLVRFVIVPATLAKDEAAYQRQIASLCEPDRTCFLNFYTNATGAPLAMPLPDAIANEATATFRRSTKNGAERFMWSCRMKLQEPCF